LARLLAALIEREEQIARAQIDEFIPDDPGDRDPGEVVVGAVRKFLEAVASRPATWRLILLPLEGTPAIVHEPVESNRAEVLGRIEKLVRWGFEHPEMPQGIDIELAARGLMAMGEEAGRLLLQDPEQYPVERYEQFARFLVGLIWPPK
jgi:hypothetical protein